MSALYFDRSALNIDNFELNVARVEDGWVGLDLAVETGHVIGAIVGAGTSLHS